MSLAEWHDQLETHFYKLHQERLKEVRRPLFALEHNLSGQELEQLKEDVRTYIRSYSPNKHWLPWIVYAAELGYEYIGYEYWQSFEESTEGWIQNGDRYYLRDYFKKFCKSFDGARPTGVWAQHFSIICFPITHAVLPKDFQRQLARVLYETRWQFTEKVLQSPKQLGQLIAANSSDQSDRFRRFVQNLDLVGLIAKGLLDYEEQDSSTILLPSTLQRILKDLELERNARDWLGDARKYAARATEKRGLTTHQGARECSFSAVTYERALPKARAIDPHLILRQSAQDRWEVLLEVPDFSPLLTEYPTLRSFLTTSRSTVKGADTKHRFARGQLLSYGAQEVPLRSFPPNGVTLLQFEGAVPDELRHVLDADFRLSTNTLTLCRIATDGRAYQMSSMLVRPQRRYIILSTTTIKPNPLCKPIHVTCSGISAFHLQMPEHLTDEHQARLEDLGLTVAKRVCVSPAGFVAAGWDGEGRGEWLADEVPCVAISADHSVQSFQLELDGDESNSLEVVTRGSSSPLFIELPLLSVGKHNLRIASRPRVTDQYEELGHLEIVIKEPRTWKPGINTQGALIVLTDPRSPSLEQLWEGRVSVEMHGPTDHSVKCIATFLGKDSTMPVLASKNLFTLQLPVKPTVWKTQINEQLKSKAIQKAVEQAYACRLDFDAGELGIFSINCERELNPLRWAVERDGDTYVLSLLDDSGGEDSIYIVGYDLTKPNVPIPLTSNSTLRKYPVPASGGLYVARSHQAECSVVVPHKIPSEFRSFSELRNMKFVTQFRECKRDVICLAELIRLYELWLGARTTGSAVAEWAQRKVRQDLLAQIFKVICDKSWAAAETSFVANPSSYDAIQNFSRAVCGVSPLAQSLASFCQRTAELTPECRAEQMASIMESLISPIELPDSQSTRTVSGVRLIKSKRAIWQLQFALRLASAPETVQNWSGNWYETGLNGLLNNKMLARAARFLVLTTHHREGVQYPVHTSLYAGWEWP